MRKLLTTLLIAALVACYSIVPVSADVTIPGTLDGTATLTITPSITTAVAGSDAVVVTYTIKVTPPTGKEIGYISFHLTAPTGETLGTADADYTVNTSMYYHKTLSPAGVFEIFDYTPASGYFAASGTTETRRMTSEAQIMTIKATIAAGQVGSFALDVADFKAGLDGEGALYTCVVKSTPVVVTGSITGTQNVTGITAPVKGSAPVTAATNPDSTKMDVSAVSWYDGTTAFTGSTFAASKAYTAKVTLTPKVGYSFASDAVYQIGGNTATVTDGTGSAKVLSYTFPATAAKSITSLEVTHSPTQIAYYHGDTFNTAGMVVKATYDDSSTDTAFTGYTVSYVDGSYLKYGNTKVTLSAGGVEVDVTGLTVEQKGLTISGLAATSRQYNGTTTVALTGGTLDGVVSGETVYATMPTSGTIGSAAVGTGKTVTVPVPTLSGDDKENYQVAVPADITVDITPADMTGTASIAGTEKYNQTLTASATGTPADASLGYQWYRGSTEISGATSAAYTTVADDIGKILTVKISGGSNYSGTIDKSTGTIAKADYSGAAVTAPAATKTATTITVTAPVAGQEYAVSTTGTAPTSASDWNTTGQFTSLMANTAYHAGERICFSSLCILNRGTIMRKLFAVLISAMLIVCYSVVPVSAATLEGTAALTVTPNITEAEAGSSAVEVTYTIRITPPSGKEIGVCAFSLSTPDGVTLQTAEVNDELKYEPSANKTGIFASLSYTKASGYFAAFGTTSDRRLSKTAILMTVKADIASGRTGSYALKIKGFTAGVDGSGDYYSSEVRSEAVTVTEASAGGDNSGTVTPADGSALIAAIQATKITYPNATSVKAGKVRLTWIRQ